MSSFLCDLLLFVDKILNTYQITVIVKGDLCGKAQFWLYLWFCN